jgi:2'-5' RNA ligase
MRDSEEHPPIIISLVLDEGTQEFITRLRGRYFPKSRNHLQGHITLFHALPSKAPHMSDIKKRLEQLCASTHAFRVGLRPPSLSRNSRAVFVPLSARPLYDVHSSLLDAFKHDLKLHLTDQDANPKFWPHATVINKVDEQDALDAFESLQEERQVESQPAGKAIGLDMWWYRGGPWEHIRRFDFTP